MNILRTTLLSLGLLLLSGNATAIMINGDVGGKDMRMDLSLVEIASLLRDYQAESKKETKLLKKANKKYGKANKLTAKIAGMSEEKAAKKQRKLDKKNRKLASILNKMNLDLIAYMASEVNPGPTDSGTVGDTRSVPEPPIIALLGIGLVGFAATRRLRRHTTD